MPLRAIACLLFTLASGCIAFGYGDTPLEQVDGGPPK